MNIKCNMNEVVFLVTADLVLLSGEGDDADGRLGLF